MSDDPEPRLAAVLADGIVVISIVKPGSGPMGFKPRSEWPEPQLPHLPSETVDAGEVIAAVEQFLEVYPWAEFGPAHLVLGDYNFDDRSIGYCEALLDLETDITEQEREDTRRLLEWIYRHYEAKEDE